MFKRKWIVATALAITLQGSLATFASAATTTKMTQYRVYQNNKALKEFVEYNSAITYAKSFSYSHIEKISNHQWVWDNFPRYAVYQNGVTTPARQFRSYNDALRLAQTLVNAHIRDFEKPGWIYSRYNAYQLYQGDKTQASWSYLTLDEAKKEAKKWSNAHIIELSTGEWIWDNISDAQLAKQRAGNPVYDITVDGESAGAGTFASLYDAVQAAASIQDSVVVNLSTGVQAHSNVRKYEVQQNGRKIAAFVGLQAAVHYAKGFSNTRVMKDEIEWWTNVPFLTVSQSGRALRAFHTRASAVTFAAGYANASVTTADGHIIWSNESKLLYLGWNGTSDSSSILNQLSKTQGLDIDSPTWFKLGDSTGKLVDNSSKELAASIKSKGLKLWPLVHNDFDAKRTTAFLANSTARKTFINQLVNRVSSLGSEGINLDFEGLAASDRAAFTKFVRELTEAAHARNLKVSIDLIRGDVRWNDKTAYDFAAIGAIVDTVVMMAYDQHWKGSDTPGSVAEMKWVEEGIKQYLNYGIPRSKLLLGIPFYVREWKLNSSGAIVKDAGGSYVSRAVLMNQLPQLIQEKHAVGTYDPESGQTKYKYTENGYTYVFWAETTASVAKRVDIAKKYDLAGAAFWRLGYEDEAIWATLLQKK
ncbi:glycosyl hydrolase family 18 protein [Paenibacillus xylaniclasticus]|uniref:glycosyl hydrolase family 18 protein n=1 Tax=Paenibacillus xylaniclasticus TaxID=588083 RepID=UPI001775F31E|nr:MULTISPECIES: glycosyl hydrolase family 18 protein [Paenibacillus]GFN30772.1 hypothetical protein PCURB6_10320 [Paenibacillus curdlanolyticus]